MTPEGAGAERVAPSEGALAILFTFRRRGLDRMTVDEVTRALSFDLRWFDPTTARRLVDAAVVHEVLRPNGDGTLRLADGFGEAVVPVGFRPDPSLPFDDWFRASSVSGMSSDRPLDGLPKASPSAVPVRSGASTADIGAPMGPRPAAFVEESAAAGAGFREGRMEGIRAFARKVGLGDEGFADAVRLERARHPLLDEEAAALLALARRGHDVRDLARAALAAKARSGGEPAKPSVP